MPDLPPPPAVESVSRATGDRLAMWVARLRRDGSRLRQSLAAAGGVVAVAVLAAVAWAAFARGAGVAPPPELTMPRAGITDEAQAGSGPPAPSSAVVAHVAGAVRRPGLYRLGKAPRIADAIDAAGGPTGDADIDAVNLAAPVADGERVYLPRRGEPPPALAGSGTNGATAGPIDLNTATAEQLDVLPGIGPATAAAIVAYRSEHGRFRSVDELLDVRGIGDAKLAELRPKVRVSR